jgi:predicted nucleic acid-binding protein
MRIVLDTGVIVSGLLIADSIPRQAIDRARRATTLFSVARLEELDEVLRRPKLDACLSAERTAAGVPRRLGPRMRGSACRGADDDLP